MEEILNEYDFIGVTSRMDESLVALALILKLPLTDTLPYTPSRSSGTYDYNPGTNACFFIKKGSPTVEMREYFASQEWKAEIAGDAFLYAGANLSLDRTIEKIGKEMFRAKLGRFQELKDAVSKFCGSAECTRCSATGEVRSIDDPRCNRASC